MNTDIEPIRMTLRLPKTLRTALESAVAAGGACSSVTAEIIRRLENSLDTDPIDTDDACAIIEQHAAKIRETVARIATNTPSSFVASKIAARKLLGTNEQRLLEAFNALSDTQQQITIDVLLSMIKLMKT